MKVVSYLNGVSQRLVMLDEILPERASTVAPFISGIMSRYAFRAVSDQPGNTNIGALNPIFQNGTFDYDGIKTPILSLDISANRITGICSTTDQADAFVSDLLSFLYSAGFRKPGRDVTNFNSSTMVVDFGPGFLERISIVSVICNILNEKSSAVHGKANFAIQSSKFVSPIDTNEGPAQLLFVLEERAGRPLGTNWMFTASPSSTNDHLDVLEKIEAAVSLDSPQS